MAQISKKIDEAIARMAVPPPPPQPHHVQHPSPLPFFTHAAFAPPSLAPYLYNYPPGQTAPPPHPGYFANAAAASQHNAFSTSSKTNASSSNQSHTDAGSSYGASSRSKRGSASDTMSNSEPSSQTEPQVGVDGKPVCTNNYK